MRCTCVVTGCENQETLYDFPQDIELRYKWLDFVRKTREGFAPGKSSSLCALHFTKDKFDTEQSEKLGAPVLKLTAIPSIYPKIYDISEDDDEATNATVKVENDEPVPEEDIREPPVEDERLNIPIKVIVWGISLFCFS